MTESTDKRGLSRFSDAQVLALYEKHDKNASSAAREVGCGPSTFRERVSLLLDPTYVSEKDKRTGIAFLMEELEARGIDPRAINIKGAKVGTTKKTWEAMHKSAEGDAVVTPLKGDHRAVHIEFSPKFAEGPAWPVIAPGSPTVVKYAKRSPVKQAPLERVFFWPDTQIGFYRDIVTNELEPFHDEAAIEVALQMLHDFQPHKVVILGDFLDLQTLSKYLQIAEFQLTLQPALNYGVLLLSRMRSAAGPECQFEMVEGNHERRLSEYITRNAREAYGLRPGVLPGERPPKWPLLCVPNLLRLDEFGVTYSTPYPGGNVWLTPKLVVQHQPPLRTTDIRATIVCGHSPQYSETGRTVHYHDGAQTYYTHIIPGLMRTGDGVHPTRLTTTAVPSNSSRMNWSQGIGVAYILDSNRFQVEVVPIHRGFGIFQGRPYCNELKEDDG